MRASGLRSSAFAVTAFLAVFAVPSCMAAKLLVPNLADPSVVQAPDGDYYLTGTNANNDFIKIYRSPDLGVKTPFAETETYDPSAFGDSYRYCWNWAAEISYHDGKPRLLFSGVRVGKHSACPPPDNLGLFTADSAGVEGGKFNFGPPRPISFPGVNGAPYSPVTSAACPPQGCDRALRIDGHYFTDPGTGRTWLNYVWFQDGCHVAGVDVADPGKVVRLADPTYAWEHGLRDVVAEAPSVFVRGGRYYYLFSHNRFDESYGTSYYKAGSFAEFNTGRYRHQLTEAVVNRSGRILLNSGHGTVLPYGNRHYYVYHVGRFSNGRLSGRDAYLSPLSFDENGDIKNLTTVDLSWPRVSGAEYSLDIVTRGGEKIAPCVDAGIIKRDLGTVYEGYCPSARDRLVDKSDIAQFQVCYAFNGDWASATCVAREYDGEDDKLDLAPLSRPAADQEEPADMLVADVVGTQDARMSGLERFFDSGSEAEELRGTVWQDLQEGSGKDS